MGSTLLLDRTAWDLVLDSSGNIAVATEPYSISQDVASALRTFLGEVYYDTTQGMPYWQQILGEPPAISIIQAKAETVALTVPGVAKARCIISSVSERTVTGQVQIIDTDGNESNVSFPT